MVWQRLRVSEDGEILSRAKSILKACSVKFLKKKNVKHLIRKKFKQPDLKTKQRKEEGISMSCYSLNFPMVVSLFSSNYAIRWQAIIFLGHEPACVTMAYVRKWRVSQSREPAGFCPSQWPFPVPLLQDRAHWGMKPASLGSKFSWSQVRRCRSSYARVRKHDQSTWL